MNNSLGTNVAVATCSHLSIPAVQKLVNNQLKKISSHIRLQVNTNHSHSDTHSKILCMLLP